MVLKLTARRPSSSRSSASMRWPRSWVRATRSAAPVSRRTGTSAARETSRPSAAASKIPPRLTPASTQRRLASVLSTAESGSATCQTPPPRGVRSVSTRTWVPATVASLKYAPLRPAATARVAALTGSPGPSSPERSTLPSGVSSWAYPCAPPSLAGGRTIRTAERVAPLGAGAGRVTRPVNGEGAGADRAPDAGPTRAPDAGPTAAPAPGGTANPFALRLSSLNSTATGASSGCGPPCMLFAPDDPAAASARSTRRASLTSAAPSALAWTCTASGPGVSFCRRLVSTSRRS